MRTNEDEVLNQTLTRKPVRQSNFELLRIVAMLLIIIDHSQYFGGLNISCLSTFNYYTYIAIVKFGQLGNTLFFLISGYFLCKKEFKIQSALRIVFEVIFYSVLTWLVALVYESTLGSGNLDDLLSLNVILDNLIISKEKYWFVFSYLLLYLLYPFLNKISNQLSQKQFRVLLIIFYVVLEIYQILRGEPRYFHENFCKVLFTYFIGSYLKLYHSEKDRENNIFYFLIFIISILICVIDSWFDNYLSFQYAEFPIIIAGVSLFMLFKNMKNRRSKIINLVGGCTFGVYLIHESPYIRVAMWTKVINLSLAGDGKFFILKLICFVLLIFLVSTIIDIFRQKCLEKGFLNFICKKFANGLDKINNLFPKIENSETIVSEENSSDKRFVILIITISLIAYISMIFTKFLIKTINAVSLFVIISFVLTILLGSLYLLYKVIKKHRNKSQNN